MSSKYLQKLPHLFFFFFFFDAFACRIHYPFSGFWGTSRINGSGGGWEYPQPCQSAIMCRLWSPLKCFEIPDIYKISAPKKTVPQMVLLVWNTGIKMRVGLYRSIQYLNKCFLVVHSVSYLIGFHFILSSMQWWKIVICINISKIENFSRWNNALNLEKFWSSIRIGHSASPFLKVGKAKSKAACILFVGLIRLKKCIST